MTFRRIILARAAGCTFVHLCARRQYRIVFPGSSLTWGGWLSQMRYYLDLWRALRRHYARQ